MNPTRLHNDLLEAGERLQEAVATERRVHAQSGAVCQRKSWGTLFRVARREVKWAAERYAGALRAFRLATVGAFVPVPQPAMARLVSNHHRRAVCASYGAPGQYPSPAVRKDIGEAFPRSTRRSKSQ